jgi:O-6-methylguanine DNA methyltransferase
MSFKERVLEVVRKILKGKVLTYKEVARLAGRPKAWRAVGNILNKNKDKKIPCHRVIRSDYGVGGYKNGIRKKVYLLRKEGMLIRNWKIENQKKKKRRVNEKKKD